MLQNHAAHPGHALHATHTHDHTRKVRRPDGHAHAAERPLLWLPQAPLLLRWAAKRLAASLRGQHTPTCVVLPPLLQPARSETTRARTGPGGPRVAHVQRPVQRGRVRRPPGRQSAPGFGFLLYMCGAAAQSWTGKPAFQRRGTAQQSTCTRLRRCAYPPPRLLHGPPRERPQAPAAYSLTIRPGASDWGAGRAGGMCVRGWWCMACEWHARVVGNAAQRWRGSRHAICT